MKLSPEKTAYLRQPMEVVCGSMEHPETCIRRYTGSGLYERVHEIDSGLGGEPVEILQITDVHFNCCDDYDARNEELSDTLRCRKWNAGAASVQAIRKCMEYAAFFDQTVITGDVLDYLSHGAVKLLEREIWDVDPDALIAPGGHELVREMETGKGDRTPFETRHAIVDFVWRHDPTYVSKIVGKKAMVIVLDNSRGRYLPGQADKMRDDLALAREQGLPVLLFQHEPLATGDPEDAHKQSFRRYDPEYHDFYAGSVGAPGCDPVTAELYALITGSADVIRGVYCGHLHSAFHTELRAHFTDADGVRHERNIPQFTLEGTVYDNYAGHVLRIIVK